MTGDTGSLGGIGGYGPRYGPAKPQHGKRDLDKNEHGGFEHGFTPGYGEIEVKKELEVGKEFEAELEMEEQLELEVKGELENVGEAEVN